MSQFVSLIDILTNGFLITDDEPKHHEITLECMILFHWEKDLVGLLAEENDGSNLVKIPDEVKEDDDWIVFHSFQAPVVNHDGVMRIHVKYQDLFMQLELAGLGHFKDTELKIFIDKGCFIALQGVTAKNAEVNHG